MYNYKYVIDHISKYEAGKKVTGLMMKSIDYITVHNNANKKSTARNERAWLENPSNKNSWANYPLVVDEKECIECNDLRSVCYACTDGEFGVGNTTSISVEICELNHAKSMLNGVDVIARLLIKFNLGIDRVVPHNKWYSAKYCPRLILPQWDNFIKLIKARYDELVEINKKEEEDKMDVTKERLDIIMKQDGKKIKSIEFDSYSKLKPYLDTHILVDDSVDNDNDNVNDGLISFEDFEPFIKLKKEIKYFTKHHDVRQLQIMCNATVKPTTIDGLYGRGSESSIKAYQRSKGLKVDGIVGVNTWKMLSYEYYKYQLTQDLKIDWYDNQTKVIRIKKNEMRMDVSLCKQPTESIRSVYNRLGEKPEVIMSGGLFGMKNGVTLSYIKDDGELITEGVYSKWVIGTDSNGTIDMFGMNWLKQINKSDTVVDAIGASPSLVVGGKKNIDKTGLDHGFVKYRHPRLGLGLDEEYMYIIIIHGRDSSKGYLGATIDEMANIGIDLGIEDFIGVDGGGSISVIQGSNGEDLDDNPSNRRVDSYVAFYKK